MKDNPFTRADLGMIHYLAGYALGANQNKPAGDQWSQEMTRLTIEACAHLQILFDLIQKEEDA